MSEVELQPDQATAEEAVVERPKAPPIESRFLFVDVAALRAKQLRRGAKPRLNTVDDEAVVVPAPQPPQPPQAQGAVPVVNPSKAKAERVAMEEVREGLVDWALPDFKAVFDTR
jgi:DNA-directed RNA polymerase subunit K/omega